MGVIGVELRDHRPAYGAMGEPAELRVLRAGRRILRGSPELTVTRALNQAAGRGNSHLVLLALNRLDAITLRTYSASFFEFEGRPGTRQRQLLGLIDGAIADLETVPG
jgi:hypothetical protein